MLVSEQPGARTDVSTRDASFNNVRQDRKHCANHQSRQAASDSMSESRT
jgi:hypothetical protein